MKRKNTIIITRQQRKMLKFIFDTYAPTGIGYRAFRRGVMGSINGWQTPSHIRVAITTTSGEDAWCRIWQDGQAKVMFIDKNGPEMIEFSPVKEG
jgi:hypothetical protein